MTDADGDSTLLCDCAKNHEDGGNYDDGDASGCFVINVVDSVPVVSSERICVSVDEDDLATLKCNSNDVIVSGSHGTSPGDGGSDGSYTLASGAVLPAFKIDLSTIVSFGADKPGAFGIVIPGGVSTLKSKGETLTFKSYDTNDDGIDDKLVAKAGDRQVFTLEVGVMTGLVLFTLFDQIDHAYAQGENALSIDAGSFLTAIDSDGDHVSLSGSVEVKVIDDVPACFEAENAHLDNTSNSYEEFSLGSYGKLGADDAGKVYFVDQDGDASNNILKGTDGEAITYNHSEIVLTGYGTDTLIGTAGGTKVLEIRLSPNACDEDHDVYSVKLFKELDDTLTETHAFGSIKSGNYDKLTLENIDNSGISLRVTGYDDGDADNVNVSGVGVGNQGIGKDELLQFDFFKDANGNHAYNSNEAFEVTSFTFAVTQNNPTNQNINFEIFAYDKTGNKIELEISDLTFNPGTAANPNVITVEESGKGLLVKGVNGGNGGLDAFDDLFTLKNSEGFSKITIEYDGKSKTNSFDVTLKSFGVEEARDLAFSFDIEAKDADGDTSPLETVKVSLDGSSSGYDDHSSHGSSGSSAEHTSFLDDGSDDLYDDAGSSSYSSSQQNTWEFAASLTPPPPCACEEQVPMAA